MIERNLDDIALPQSHSVESANSLVLDSQRTVGMQKKMSVRLITVKQASVIPKDRDPVVSSKSLSHGSAEFRDRVCRCHMDEANH